MLKWLLPVVLLLLLSVVVMQVFLYRQHLIDHPSSGHLSGTISGSSHKRQLKDVEHAMAALDASLRGANEALTKKNPVRHHEGSKEVNHAGGVKDGVFDTTPLNEALEVYREKVSTKLTRSCQEQHFQSSRNFTDFRLPKSKLGWVVPESQDGVAGKCDPTAFSAFGVDDEACLTFLADKRNWKGLRPMNSVLSEARTIKFMVQTVDDKVRAIIKLAQNKFPVESYSEVTAYAIDRLLGINRMPPTVWVSVPVSWFRAAMSVYMPALYVQWVECFVFSHTILHDVVADGTIHVSVQLWMEGVKPIEGTSAHLAPGDTAFLTRSPLGDLPPDRAGVVRELVLMSVFDTIIGNSDRTEHKNAFGCSLCEGPFRVFLDQGSSLFANRKVNMKKALKGCRVPRGLYEKMKSYSNGRLAQKLRKTLPTSLTSWRYLNIEGAQDRLDDVVGFYKECLEAHEEAEVFPTSFQV